MPRRLPGIDPSPLSSSLSVTYSTHVLLDSYTYVPSLQREAPTPIDLCITSRPRVHSISFAGAFDFLYPYCNDYNYPIHHIFGSEDRLPQDANSKTNEHELVCRAYEIVPMSSRAR